MLASLKRRLLRSNTSQQPGIGSVGAPPPQPTSQLPAPPPPPPPSKLVDQLAALQLQFAALPPPRAKQQHSAGVLLALEALKARFPADADASPPGLPPAPPAPPEPRKRAARSPQRRMNRSATLPAPRAPAGRRPAWRDPTVERELGGAAESSAAPARPGAAAAAAPDESSTAGPSAAARPKLAALKRRQSRRSDAHPGPSPVAPLLLQEASGAFSLPGDEGEANWHLTDAEPSAPPTSMPDSPRRYLAARITPRVLAAAEQTPSPAASSEPLAAEGSRPDSGLWRRTISSGGGSRRGSLTGGDSDLWAGLSRAATPLAAQGGASPLVLAAGSSRRGSSQSELEWRAQGMQAHAASSNGGVQAGAAAGRAPAVAASAATRGAVPQRLSRHELPADLLSLRESASLVQQSQVGRPPRPPPRRVPRKAASAQDEPAAGAPSAVAASAATDQGMASGRAAQRVASLRERRRGGWQSDLPADVPSWRFSQEQEPSEALPPLAVQLPAAPSPGLTHAQRRQQEAWGGLAGMSLEQVLKQRGRAAEAPEGVCERENSGRESNGSTPTSPAALGGGVCPKPADSLSPAPQQQQLLPALPPQQAQAQPQPCPDAGSDGGPRQARRRTLPPPTFVESLERMAALQRACSDSEQQEGGILWRQVPTLRGGRALQQGASASPGHLPPLQQLAGGSAAELHELRLLCPGSRLASARAEAEAAGLEQQLERAAAVGRPQAQRSQSMGRPAQAAATPQQAPTAAALALEPPVAQQPSAPQWQQQQKQHWQGQPPAARPPVAAAAPTEQWWQPGQKWHAPHGYNPQQQAQQAAWQAAQQAAQAMQQQAALAAQQQAAQQQGTRSRRKWIEAPAAQQQQPQAYSSWGYWPDQAAAQQAAAATYWAGAGAGQYAGAPGWPYSHAAAPGGMLPPLRGIAAPRSYGR